MSFSEACRSNGRKPSSHIISCHIMEMQEWQQDFFKPEHTKIYHIERILSADNLPIIYEHIYYSNRFFFQIFKVEKLEMDLLTTSSSIKNNQYERNLKKRRK